MPYSLWKIYSKANAQTNFTKRSEKQNQKKNTILREKKKKLFDSSFYHNNNNNTWLFLQKNNNKYENVSDKRTKLHRTGYWAANERIIITTKKNPELNEIDSQCRPTMHKKIIKIITFYANNVVVKRDMIISLVNSRQTPKHFFFSIYICFFFLILCIMWYCFTEIHEIFWWIIEHLES